MITNKVRVLVLRELYPNRHCSTPLFECISRNLHIFLLAWLHIRQILGRPKTR